MSLVTGRGWDNLGDLPKGPKLLAIARRGPRLLTAWPHPQCTKYQRGATAILILAVIIIKMIGYFVHSLSHSTIIYTVFIYYVLDTARMIFFQQELSICQT